MSVPVYAFRAERANLAFAAYAALMKTQRADPTLKNNPAWTAIRQDAYAAYLAEFERVK